jgi:uncharacterized protein YkwD
MSKAALRCASFWLPPIRYRWPLWRWIAITLAVVLVIGVEMAVPAATRPDDTNDRYADQLGVLVNRYREQHGRKPLPVDRTLAALAREHSAAMAKAGRLSHDDYQSRFRRSGYAMCVENVGWNYPTPQAQVLAWQRSSGHDRNLLDARVEHMGIGATSDYVTFIGCR